MNNQQEKQLRQIITFHLDPFGDGIEDEFRVASDELILFPSNGNSIEGSITLVYNDGTPAPGKTVTCSSRPLTLTGAEWRTVDGLAPRFNKSEATIRERISQQLIRLGVMVTPTSTVTDANGKAVFRLDSYHVCGNEATPASDEIIITSEAGVSSTIIKSAVEGLQSLSNDPTGGLTTEGLVGRHLNPEIIQVLQAIGKAWQRVTGKPEGMPNYITVTGASMRWGGLNPPHMTHRFGGTADVRPIGTKPGPVKVGDEHYHKEATGIIIDYMRQTGASQILFADDLPGVTKVDQNHKDHFHVSWLKNPDEPWFTVSSKRLADLAILLAGRQVELNAVERKELVLARI